MSAFFLRIVADFNARLARILDWCSPAWLLALRLYVADVFFTAGLTKIRDFSSTVALFENEYRVPVISPMLAAASGTAAELVLPILLALGIASRPTAILLFVFNAIACISYPEISDAGIKDHVAWGVMLLVVVFHGGGRFTIDAWVARRFGIRPA